MLTPPSRHAITHDRILDVAARSVRRLGVAGVGVADVMGEAGLTRGGFYAHFASREALLVEALERAGRDSSRAMAERIERRAARGVGAFRALVERYLSTEHLREVASGCVVAALGSEMARQPPALLEASAAPVRELVAMVGRALPPGSPRGEAAVVSATLVGTLQLARTLGEGRGAAALMAAARRSLLERHPES